MSQLRRREPSPITVEKVREYEGVIAAATPLQLMIAETQSRLGRRGYDVVASAQLIDAWFPEATSQDKSQAVEIGAAQVLLQLAGSCG